MRLDYLKAFTNTSVWRYTFTFSVIVLVICFVLLFIVFHFTVSAENRAIEDQVRSLALGLEKSSDDDQMTLKQFVHTINDRTEHSNKIVLAMLSEGKVVGNLGRLPFGVSDYPALSNFPVAIRSLSGEIEPENVLGTRVSTRFGVLYAGRFNNRSMQEIRFFIAGALGLAGTAIFTVGAGIALNRRFLARIHGINELVEEVRKGKLDQRLPLTSRGDEYDMISAKINHMLDDIDGLVHSVSTLTDNIAHDLRTPLSRVRIMIEDEIALEEDESKKKRFEGIQNEISQLLETFQAMLELSRLEKGSTHLEKKRCNLSVICRDVIDLITPLLESNENLDCLIDEDIFVYGDPHLLFRAIYNVMDNTICFSPEGEAITIALSGTQLTISDRGPGIPEHERENVFRRLYQIDQSRHKDGYGMGLSIVRAILRKHGGDITLADNNPGLKAILNFGISLTD
jgi:signal transduction histidine kinase